MTTNVTIEPVRRTIAVRADRKRAFRLFTEGIATWWPLETHSVFGDHAETVVFECRENGRIYERHDDGRETDWGHVLVWEPPGRVVFDWAPEPGTPAPTEVEVTFTEEGEVTRVDLVHREWERLGSGAAEKRSSYASGDGWTLVIGSYVEAAGA